MGKSAGKPRRRQYLIDRRFQLPVALALAGIGLVMLTYHLVVVHFVVEGARAGAIVQTQPLWTMIPLLALLVVAAAYLGVHVTHRIVGPAYRLIQSMHAYSAGDYSVRSHLRAGDALKDVATALNEVGEALEKRDGELRAAIRDGASSDQLLAMLDRENVAMEEE